MNKSAISEGELTRRRVSLAECLRQEGQDALLFTREGTVTYVSGYRTITWLNFSRPVMGLLDAAGELALIVAESEADAAREQVPDARVHTYVELRRVEPAAGLPDGRVQFTPHAVEVLEQVLADWGVRRLMVEGLAAAFPPFDHLTSMMRQPPALTDASALIWTQRLVKSDWEIECMARSCAVIERAFEELDAELRAGMTEREIRRVFASAVFGAGGDDVGYVNVVAGVHRGLMGAPSDRRWEPGEVLYVDGGAVLDGYWADFCRMYVCDTASSSQTEGYGRALKALDAAADSFEERMTAGELAAVIASATGVRADSIGFGRFGHGIGLYMPEPPSLHPLDDTPLTEGVVICVEPAVMHEGANYVVEEERVVRSGRFELISPAAPRELIRVAQA